MAGQNRYLRGKVKTVLAEVLGAASLEAGDLVFLNNVNGTAGVGVSPFLLQADNRVYSLSDHKTSTDSSTWTVRLSNQFMGVAMEGSQAGVTEKVTVATTGIYRYPLYSVSAVTTGSKISAVSTVWSTTSDGSLGTSRQVVINHNSAAASGSTVYLGHCVKTESGASFVDFEIWSAIYDGALA